MATDILVRPPQCGARFGALETAFSELRRHMRHAGHHVVPCLSGHCPHHHRPQHRNLVGQLRRPRHQLANLQPRRPRRNRPKPRESPPEPPASDPRLMLRRPAPRNITITDFARPNDPATRGAPRPPSPHGTSTPTHPRGPIGQAPAPPALPTQSPRPATTLDATNRAAEDEACHHFPVKLRAKSRTSPQSHRNQSGSPFPIRNPHQPEAPARKLPGAPAARTQTRPTGTAKRGHTPDAGQTHQQSVMHSCKRRSSGPRRHLQLGEHPPRRARLPPSRNAGTTPVAPDRPKSKALASTPTA